MLSLRPDSKQHGPRRRKLDRLALRQHVAHHPEATLKERAPHFGVAINAIWYALQQVKVTHKKNLRYAERDPSKRGGLSPSAPTHPHDTGGGQAGLSG